MSDQTEIAGAVPFDPSPGSVAEQAIGRHGPLTLRLKADLATAMRAGDDKAKSALRMAIAALQNAEVAGDKVRALAEDEELTVLTREAKSRKESAETYAAAGRPELAAAENFEADFLARYLPQPLTPDELAEVVDGQVAALAADRGNPPTMRDMGALVRAVNQQVAGRADGAAVAALVKARLT